MKTSDSDFGYVIDIEHVIAILLHKFRVDDTSKLTPEQLPEFIKDAEDYVYDIKFYQGRSYALNPAPTPALTIEELKKLGLISHDHAQDYVAEIRYLLSHLI